MAIEIKYALNMALQYNNANEFDIEDYLLADNETGKLFLTESPSKRVLNESEKSALYFLIDDSLFNASAFYEMYDSGNNKISEFIIELGYDHLIHNAIPVNVDFLPVTLDTTRLDVSIVSNQNLLLYPSEFSNPVWSKTNITVSSNSITAPDGTLTADTITASNVTNSIDQTVSGSGVYVFSIYLKQGTQTQYTVTIRDLTPSGLYTAIFDLSTGTYVGNAGNTSFNNIQITPLDNDWYKIELTQDYQISGTIEIFQSVGGVGSLYFWEASLRSASIDYLTEIKSYQIDRECYDYLFQVNWLNKLGGRDTFMFGAKPIIGTTVDRNNLIELSKLRNFESPKRIYGYREHISYKTYSIAQHCKDRATAEWLKRELIDSIDVMLVVNDDYYPVMVTNSSVEEDKVSHDYKVNLSFRLAFDNNIQTR